MQMKIGTHMAFNFFSGMALGFSYLDSAFLAAGGIIPDVLDRFFSLGSRPLWHGVHRKASHWPWPYLAGAIFLSGIPQLVLLGAFLHCALDALTPSGIPLLWPFGKKGRLKVGVIRTGSIFEIGVIAAPALVWLYAPG